MEEIQDRVESERRYRTLLRRMAGGAPAPAETETILAITGRTLRDLERDLIAWRERARLAARAERIVELTDHVAIAREGYLLVRQSARRAREEAEAQEARARASYEAIARQMQEARAADEALKAMVEPELRSAWCDAEDAVHEARSALREARLEGRNGELLEAVLESAEERLRAVRREAL